MEEKTVLLHRELRKADCNWETVLELVDNGANLNSKLQDGMTPLHLAVERTDCNLDACKQMIRLVADINEDDDSGYTVLQCALNNKHCNLEIVTVLLEKGADLNAKGFHGLTPLSFAVNRNDCNWDIFKKIVSCMSDMNAVDASDQTVLDYALMLTWVKWENVEELIDMGLDILKSSGGKRLLCLALERANCNWDAVSKLILAGTVIGEWGKRHCWSTPFRKMLEHPNFNLNLDAIKYLLRPRFLFYRDFFNSVINSNFRPRNLKCILWLLKNMLLTDLDMGPLPSDIADDLQLYKNACMTETSRMKSQPIEESLFVWLNDPFLPLNTLDYAFECVIQSLVSNSYPIYKDMILVQIPKKLLVDILKKSQIYYSKKVINSQQTKKVVIVSDCIHIFSAYLSNEDLFGLYMAFDVSDNSKHSCSMCPPLKKKRIS